jgi:sugar lactone lactonase YvrE
MTYDFKPVFTYNHEQLGGISGITTDEEGNIYIAGFASNNVHQITPDGKFIRIILTESDGISNPRGISFKQDCNIIIVLNNSGEQIDLFELV